MKILKYLFGVVFAGGLIWSFVQPASSQTVGVANTGYSIRFGNVGIGTFVANPGTYATIYTAPTNGAMVKGIIASNLDTSTAHTVTCELVNGSGIVGIQFPTSVSIPAQTGLIPPVNMWSPAIVPGLPVDQWGNPFHYLPSGYTIKCTYTTALSNGYVAVDVDAGEF